MRHRGLAIVLGTAACWGAAHAAPSDPLKRRPNHGGVAFVGEWHHVEPGKGPMFRTAKQFLSDLDRLYRLGFRPVTARDWLAGKMDLPKGASPVVMTFDDSNPDQFRLLKSGDVDPRCAIGLWQSFAKTHPDFPVKATFFAIPSMMWGQPRWTARKLQLLRGWGCEVANHTLTHPDLRRLSDARVQREVGGGALALDRLGEKGPYSLCYPYGSAPRNRRILKGFVYKKRRIVVPAAFIAGAGPSPMPGAKGFSRYLIPRIQPVRGENGLAYWLDRVEKGKVKPYVQ